MRHITASLFFGIFDYLTISYIHIAMEKRVLEKELEIGKKQKMKNISEEA